MTGRIRHLCRWPLAALLILVSPLLAEAHVGHGATSGWWAGLEHPITGLDHFAAMLGVGLWASQRGGRSLWIVPLAFVLVMIAGGFLGASGISLPLVEPGIVASVLVIGVLIAAAVPMPLAASVLVVGLFALVHGHAHGAEMPGTAAGASYGLGFTLSTLLLIGAGMALGRAAQSLGQGRFVRYAGGAIALLGVYLCIT